MIRHSSLPKLEQCACYESAGGNSPAAARGTRMDEAFRFALAGDTSKFRVLESTEDKEAVQWAVNQVRLIAGGENVISDESQLKVQTPGLEHIGTEDSRIPSKCTSLDLKSGIRRDYYAQMAAYAYGNMERDFAPGWTCYLLFCDQKQIVTHHFTYEQAKMVVENILEAVADPEKKPTPSEYCNWCKNKEECLPLGKAASDTLEIVDSDLNANLAQLKKYLADSPETLAAFIAKAAIFNDQLVDWARELAKEKLVSGEEIPGYKLQKVKGTDYIDPTQVARALNTSGATMQEVVKFLGDKIKASDMKDFLDNRQCDFQFDVIQGKGYTKLTQDKKKK
jgi:hypothetical protein